MDTIFESYLSCFIEKEVSGDYSLYITCSMNKSLFEKWKSLCLNLEDAEELETEPHCTFLWCKLDEDYDADRLFDLLQPELEDISFDLQPMGFKVFEEVSDGTQNCLVVRMDAPGHVVQKQTEIKTLLDQHNVKFTQDFPEWKPHMTIGYFPLEIEIKYDQPGNGMLDAPVEAKVDYMKVHNGKEMKFNKAKKKLSNG